MSVAARLGMLGSGVLLRLWDWHAIFWAMGAAALRPVGERILSRRAGR